jgi:hypothetical protein
VECCFTIKARAHSFVEKEKGPENHATFAKHGQEAQGPLTFVHLNWYSSSIQGCFKVGLYMQSSGLVYQSVERSISPKTYVKAKNKVSRRFSA